MNTENGSRSEQGRVPMSAERRRQFQEYIISRPDNTLHDLLMRLSEERDKDKNILDMEIGRSLSNIDTREELTWAKEDAVKKRTHGIESIHAYTWSQPYDRSSRVVALWYGEEPKLPEFLENILHFELQLNTDPREIRPDISRKIHPKFLGILKDEFHNGDRARHVDTAELETDDRIYPVQLQADALSNELMTVCHLTDAIHCNALFSAPKRIDLVDSLQDPALNLKNVIEPHGDSTGQKTSVLVAVEDMEDDSSSTLAFRDDTKESLVYARHHGKIIPLGIHCGSHEGSRVNSKLGLRLTFCSPDSCPHKKAAVEDSHSSSS
ncbi:uncharacterized protein BDW43DRAFT_299681 [Aspergillus alliaceus]|uniref:uncharacterized protein n=1 Tax=Petromyces alliaceus TaxID=209559 RepID=UPI0012A70C8D|nr:uncharacterized protein BDW43DRAFT_299681 [Aspergillus alliaceus]KAB8234300.1 hypothetical protein BDW43DRAFT_299681 [Aspergillus alliaceus]